MTLRLLAALGFVMLVSACAPTAPPSASQSKMSAAGTVGMGGYKLGNPYQVNGSWYYPKEDYGYDETGIASWYGADFHDKKTANGERFDKNELTAAHKTLPLPSLVRVTNLENGRSVVVRVNDRGPFTPGRIIDLSEKGAKLLEFDKNGTAKVRVQVLADESRSLAEAAKKGLPAEKLAETVNGPAVSASPVVPVKVAQAAPLAPPTAPAVPEKVNLPGRLEDNRFLPAAKVDTVPVTKGRALWVQVGAFSKQENAVRLKERLAGVGNASVSAATVNQAEFHRVRIGPVETVEKADEVLNHVLAMGLNGARIVVE